MTDLRAPEAASAASIGKSESPESTVLYVLFICVQMRGGYDPAGGHGMRSRLALY